MEISGLHLGDILDQVLAHPRKREAFEEHLRGIYAWENLAFIEAVRDYATAEDPVYRRVKLRSILRSFIGSEAEYEVNLDSPVRRRLQEHVTNEQLLIDPPKDLFAEAYDQIFLLLLNSCLNSFLNTPTYRNIDEERSPNFRGQVFVKVLAAMLRSPPDRCNAYVVIDCGNLRQRSSVAWDMGASPSWSSDDIHCFTVDDTSVSVRLTCRSSHIEREPVPGSPKETKKGKQQGAIAEIDIGELLSLSDSDFLGEVHIAVEDLLDEAPVEMWFPLRESYMSVDEAHDRGELYVKAIYCADPSAPVADVGENDFRYPLHSAAGKGHLAAVQRLIADGRDVNERDDDARRTPLHFAIIRRQREVTKALLEAGAEPNAVDNNGQTPLHVACAFAAELVHILVQFGAQIGVKDLFGGAQTPLHLAATYNNSECAEYLVAKGANMNALNVREETPLMCAVLRGAVEAAAVLVECGADVTLKNTAGKTALDLAKSSMVFARAAELQKLLREAADSLSEETSDIGVSNEPPSSIINCYGEGEHPPAAGSWTTQVTESGFETEGENDPLPPIPAPVSSLPAHLLFSGAEDSSTEDEDGRSLSLNDSDANTRTPPRKRF